MTNHEALMRRAMEMADTARIHSRPNPWVGAVLVCADGSVFEGATQPPGGAHAEIVALTAAHSAGANVRGATLYSTLEPCSHTGRTGPCTAAIIEAQITHVVSGITDPDENVAGTGFAQLRDAGVQVTEGVCAEEITQQLLPYLHHRRTGRPFVMLKMATTLDARTIIPNGPRWITGDVARERVHQLRAESDAILVGASTVRADDPALTVRHIDAPSPRRIVLSRTGDIPANAQVHPCTVWSDDIEILLDTLGSDGVLQLMLEGGPTVASEFHDRGFINRYVFHIAPVVTGSTEAPGVFAHDEQSPLADCRLVSATALGADLEIVLDPVLQKVESQ
jgi:diaminohydroxyphosphoribosylaminopyrimidine deaminase / 5-amino-6-(5-phosphoribosylamino)uracil reductase